MRCLLCARDKRCAVAFSPQGEGLLLCAACFARSGPGPDGSAPRWRHGLGDHAHGPRGVKLAASVSVWDFLIKTPGTDFLLALPLFAEKPNFREF